MILLYNVNEVINMSSRDFREKAWSQLKLFYWNLFVVGLIVAAVLGSNAALLGLILTGPLMVGVNRYRLNIVRFNKEDSGLLISGFKDNIIDYIITHILRAVFIFLWSLLFIIPGIIKSFSYSMTFYILADNPDLRPQEAIERSREMMRGHKWRLFTLYLSFIGWFFLALLTFGIGMFFLEPYIQQSVANFYEDLKTRTL
jgi:uncharacterized membrane protein